MGQVSLSWSFSAHDIDFILEKLSVKEKWCSGISTPRKADKELESRTDVKRSIRGRHHEILPVSVSNYRLTSN